VSKFPTSKKEQKVSDGWFDLKSPPDEKVSELRALRSLISINQPYRTQIGFCDNLTTSAAGVLNKTITVGSLISAAEWSSIDTLFDEVFVHSLEISYQPRNSGGGGASSAGVAGQLTNSAPGDTTAAGVMSVSLYDNTGAYANANAFVANPTTRHHMSTRPWSHVWTNNVRFEPNGLALDNSGGIGWQGWQRVNNAGSYGGTVQFRATGDTIIGDGTHSVTLGDFIVRWHLSFRARS